MNEKTGKPILVKVHVKKGDKVKVISGGDRGTLSEVTEVRSRRADNPHALSRRAPAARRSRCCARVHFCTPSGPRRRLRAATRLHDTV